MKRRAIGLLAVWFACMLVAGCSTGNELPLGNAAEFTSDYRTSLVSLASLYRSHESSMKLRWKAVAPFGEAALTTDATYVAQYYGTSVQQYASSDGQGPFCNVPGTSVNGIAIDAHGNLWVPNGTGLVQEYAPGCGAAGEHFTDHLGQPVAIAFDKKGNIYVANVLNKNGKKPGSVEVYSAQRKWRHALTSPFITKYVVGVAIDAKSDVVVTYTNGGSHYASAVEFPRAKMPAKALSKIQIGEIGAPLFDATGNLLIPDADNVVLNVYAPPFTGTPKTYKLRGGAVACALSQNQKVLSCADFTDGAVDVYTYPDIAYLYSYSNGLDATLAALGIANDPAAAN